jgi:CSLREA domain-containing protein
VSDLFRPRRRSRRCAVSLAGALLLIAVVAVFGASAASAATFTVNTTADGHGTCGEPGDTCTLRAALQDAENYEGGDPSITIDLSFVSGTIELTSEIDTVVGPAAIDVKGPGAGTLTIDGGDGESALLFGTSGPSVTVSGVTIADAGDSALAVGPDGEGISSTLDVEGVNFVDNEADVGLIGDIGGALQIEKGISATVQNSTFTGNRAHAGTAGAHGDGGAIATSGPLTLQNTQIRGNTADESGGGVWVGENAGVSIDSQSNISGNTAKSGDGGGVYLSPGATMRLEGEIGQNTTTKDGGGVYLQAGTGTSATIEGGIITANTAENDGGGIYQGGTGSLTVQGGAQVYDNTSVNGGGIYTSGNTTVQNADVEGNAAGSSGGGIYVEGATLLVERASVAANSAQSSGAGVYGTEASLNLTDSTIANNIANGASGGPAGPGLPGGGGVMASGGTLTVTQSTIAENSIGGSGSQGGGISYSGGAGQIENSTIAQNSASSGTAGGLYATDVASLTSTILAENGAGAGCPDGGGAGLLSEGWNVVGNACGFPAVQGDQTGVDPQLGSLQNHGGPTDTLAPTVVGSVAINRGADPRGFSSDQRGEPRPVPAGGANTDVGAYELQLPVVEGEPSISGDDVIGRTVTCDPGEWDGDGVTPTFSYTWTSAGIPVGTGAEYTLLASDAGNQLVCSVRGDNGAGAVTVSSPPITAAGLQPQGEQNAARTIDLADGFDVRVDGEAAGSATASAVADAGDVNGDGIPDELIGAPGAGANGRPGSGSVYVIYGRRGASGATVDLSTLQPSQGYRIDGASAGDGLGTSVADAGDVNGDGIPDQVIGAPGADYNGAGAGAAYVVFGQRPGPSEPLDLAALQPSQGYRLDGGAGGHAGFSVDDAGDVNGDGVPDQVIGAPAANPGGMTAAGSAYVVLGMHTPPAAPISLVPVAAGVDYEIDGAAAGDQVGRAVAGTGDVNGDGVPDQVIGAPGADPDGRSAAGAAFVVYGQRPFTFFPISVGSLSGSGYEIDGAAATDEAGFAVAAAGDVNGDGVPDQVVGAPGAGGVGTAAGAGAVVYGQRTAPAAPLDLSALPLAQGFVAAGAGAGDQAGRAVAGAGDVNGDGFADVLLGAPFAGPPGSAGAGEAYLVYGGATAPSASLALSGLGASDGYELLGAAQGDGAGSAVAGAGDVDGDGNADQLVGAPGAGANGRAGSGSAYTTTEPAAAVAVDPAGLAFGSRRAHTHSAPQTVTVESSGNVPLAIGRLVLGGPAAREYGIVSDDCSETTVAAGGECHFAVVFAPTTGGAQAATVQVPTSAGDQTVALSGSGVVPPAGVSITPAELDFGTVDIGAQGDAQAVTITSTGQSPLGLEQLTLSGPGAGQYRLDPGTCTSDTIAPGDDCTAQLIFVPSVAGGQTATLEIPTSVGTRQVTLVGTGSTPAPPQPPPPSPPGPPAPPSSGPSSGSGPTGASGPSPPQVTIAPTATGQAVTAHVSARGVVTIPVRCMGTTRNRCRGTLTLATASAATRRVAAGVALGSASFTIAAGHTTGVTVKLGRTAMRLLSTLPRLRTRAHVIARGGTDAGAPALIELLPARAPGAHGGRRLRGAGRA